MKGVMIDFGFYKRKKRINDCYQQSLCVLSWDMLNTSSNLFNEFNISFPRAQEKCLLIFGLWTNYVRKGVFYEKNYFG